MAGCFAACLLLLSSCSYIFKKTMGILDSDDLLKIKNIAYEQAEMFGYSDNELYYLPNSYLEYVQFLEDSTGKSLSNFRDSYQIIIFNHQKEMISFCSAGLVGTKFPHISGKLSWNETGIYDSFPPSDIYSKPITNSDGSVCTFQDSTSKCGYLPKVDIEFDSLREYIIPFKKDRTENRNNTSDYHVFILAGLYVSNTFESTLEAVQANIDKADSGINIRRYLVFTDTYGKNNTQTMFD